MITNLHQRWRTGRSLYSVPSATINPLHYDVAEIDDERARRFVLEHHYSGTYPSARRRFGLFRFGVLAGVAVFSYPVNDKTITNVFKCESARDGLELGRFVLTDDVPANGETWFLARCRERLKNDFVGFVMFSDDVGRTNIFGEICFGGHIGTIYQASSAAFLGRGTARYLRLLPDGRVFSDRALQKIRKAEQGWIYAAAMLQQFGADALDESADRPARMNWLRAALDRHTRILKHPGNLKYGFSFSKRVQLHSLPYPKMNKINPLVLC